MTFHVLTLFPQMIQEAANHSIIKRAIEAGLIDIRCVDIRDFAVNKHKQVDDAPYGGGAGMVMMPQPVYDAYASIGANARVVYLTPQGTVFNQAKAYELANEEALILLCGHYEGIDERVLAEIVTDEISIGDYILTGGELAALVLMDAVSRLVPGVLGKAASHQDESFSGATGGLLEYPQFTRPPVFHGVSVPPVLLSGHHQKIAEWRHEQSLARTRQKRPDLLCADDDDGQQNGVFYMDITQCEPASVFHFFEAISRIPRGSKHEKAVSDYIKTFAEGKGLFCVQDAKYNLLIRKPGSPGYEDHAPVVLQGHLDMVCVRTPESTHDFLKDPIKLCVADGFMTAKGTSLGADNGIAVAMALAVLDADDLVHPPLEVLLTADEEAGMTGIEAFDAGLMQSMRMINLDSEEDEYLFVGCAGGMRTDFHLPAEREQTQDGLVGLTITVNGLIGGHSGLEIHMERANAIRLLGRVLRVLDEAVNMHIVAVDGGLKQNAIPREAVAHIVLPATDKRKAESMIQDCLHFMAREYRTTDPGLAITTSEDAVPAAMLTKTCGRRLIMSMLLLPNGVQAMSADMPDLVETSANIGIIKTEDSDIIIESLLRSSVPSRCHMMATQCSALGESIHATVKTSSGYPAWTYDPHSALRNTSVAVYRAVFNKDPFVKAVHAGLECGHIAAKKPGIDMISFGPNMQGVHTTEECLEIASVERVWRFLLALLKAL